MLDEQIRKAWRKKRTYTEEKNLPLREKYLKQCVDGHRGAQRPAHVSLAGCAGFSLSTLWWQLYRRLVEPGSLGRKTQFLLAKIRMKPIRTPIGCYHVDGAYQAASLPWGVCVLSNH